LILENNHRVVRIEKNNGFNIYYGDAMNIEILNYIGLAKAESVVVALDDEIACIKITRFIHQNFPTVAVITKSETFNNADRFRKVGASYVVSKNLETGLQLSQAALSSVGINANEVSSIINSFRDINNDALKDLILFNEDEENEKELLQNFKKEQLKNPKEIINPAFSRSIRPKYAGAAENRNRLLDRPVIRTAGKVSDTRAPHAVQRLDAQPRADPFHPTRPIAKFPDSERLTGCDHRYAHTPVAHRSQILGPHATQWFQKPFHSYDHLRSEPYP
jgi:hypothetical protein